MKKTILMGVLHGIMFLILGSLAAQAAPFLYQGQLKVNDTAANDSFDLQFQLFNASIGGTNIGAINYRDDLNLVNGLFTLEIDFGANAFDGAERWLEIGVRAGSADNGDRTGYQVLAPRQRIFPTPYAQHSDRATTSTAADESANAARLNNLESSDFARAVHSHTGVYSAVGHSHRTTDITSGAFPDERIADEITISGKGSVNGGAINQGVVAEKFIDPDIARDAELKTAIGAHADIADAHHIWPLTDAEIPDDITIDDSGSISAKAINSSTIGEAYISSAIARDSELAYDAVVAPSGGDYTTLQAALAANKKTILVRNGTYTLDSDIEITQSGTVIIGESRDGVIFDCNNTAFGIKAEYYGLSGGGTITIPNGGSTVTGTGTSWVTQLSDISRAYIRLGDVWYKIASIPNNTTINLTDTYRGKELSLATYASGNILKNIRLENLTIANFNSSNKGAISFSGAVDGIIKNSAANKCTDYGFRFQNSSNCQIRNNFLMSNRTAGIYIEYSRHINLSGNLCQNSTMNGILLLQSRKCTINNNHCSNNNYNGIGFDSSSYNNLTGNECVGNSRGILMDDSHYNVINANQFIDNSESGLWLTSNDDRNTIVGNTSMDNGQYGIDIQNANCSSNIVGMNTLYNNTLGAGNDLGTGTQQKTTNYPTF